MKSMTRSVAGVSGLILAGGCAMLPDSASYSVAPHESVRHSASVADGQYQLGKYYLGPPRQGQWRVGI